MRGISYFEVAGSFLYNLYFVLLALLPIFVPFCTAFLPVISFVQLYLCVFSDLNMGNCSSNGASGSPEPPKPVSFPLQNSTTQPAGKSHHAQHSQGARRPYISHRSENQISLKMRIEVLNATQKVLGASHEFLYLNATLPLPCHGETNQASCPRQQFLRIALLN